MNSEGIFSIIDSYSDDHILKQLLSSKDLPFPSSYLNFFVEAILNVNHIDPKAALDLLNHKIRAKSRNSYDFHNLLSSLCELSVINTMLFKIDDPSTFKYEPQPLKGSKKNPEFRLNISGYKYYIEVKTPNFENYRTKLREIRKSGKPVTHYESRILKLSEEEKSENMVSTDSKIKDFLIDANNKFLKSEDNTHFNVLFICWTEHTDQPATALKHPKHGLLTKNSWFKDEDGEIVSFNNIDIIFIIDLFQNHIVHMSCISEPMPSIISGVPYFDDTIKTGIIPDPFNLKNSRNAIVESQIDEKIIFPLPISTIEKPVGVITEEYVQKYCPEIKISFRL